MLAAISVLSCTDMISKVLTAEVPAAQVVWARYVFYLPVLIPMVMMQRAVLASAAPKLQVGRGLLFLGSTFFAMTAISHLPLAEMATIGFASPFATTIMSVLFLSEKVGVRRWSAIVVGFIGVLIVVRPGGVAFGWPAALVLTGTVMWSLAFVITRRIGAHDRTLTTLVWTTGVGILGGLPLAVQVWTWPDAGLWGLMAVNGMGNVLGQFLIIRAVERAAASIVIPFVYIQLAWATFYGWLIFDQTPDGGTLLGAAVIIGSGVYIWHRERVRAAEKKAG